MLVNRIKEYKLTSYEYMMDAVLKMELFKKNKLIERVPIAEPGSYIRHLRRNNIPINIDVGRFVDLYV